MNFKAILQVISSAFIDRRGTVHTSVEILGSVGMAISAASVRMSVQAPAARVSHAVVGGSIVLTESFDAVKLSVEDLR